MADVSAFALPALPELDGSESSEEKIERILDYLISMNEQYRYILCQLQSGDGETLAQKGEQNAQL